MTHASSFTRAPEPGDHVAFEPAENDFPAGPHAAPGGPPDFAAIREHPDFVAVRGRLTRFVLPVSALFLAWYLTYVLLAAYAPGFMAHRVTGSVTAGLLLGLSQFVSTVAIMLWYARFTRRNIDPKIAELRAAAGETDHDR
ncbi:DUF485 domain-containing protein [Actinophytocola glycyrrhizae]|uniref:DUF485 domain-containing protein n=1 Tax=Actinophytocola glycyrrhizae TaxID=2044873 RepID=A0ABV9S3T6_9PSEU